MNAASDTLPLQQALRNQETLPCPSVKVADTLGIKIPMSGVERILDVESETAGDSTRDQPIYSAFDDSATLEKAAKGNKIKSCAPPAWEKAENSYPVIQKEKPAHRIIAYMAASGATTQRIADETGFGVQHVRILLNQSWMKAHIAQLIHENFNDDVSGILKAGAIEAIMTIRSLSQDSVNEKIKLAASQDILDRYRGKATQFVHTSSSEVPQDPTDEIARLQENLKELALESSIALT